jgi:glycosyltransferase involved in cell wall biosynthesis
MPIKDWPPVKIITGVTSDDDIHALHKAGEVYVNSSRAEGFCIPAFESLAHGNTLISSSVGGMAEYVSPETSLVMNAMGATVYEMQGDPALTNGVACWFEPSTAEMANLMRTYHLLKQGHDAGNLTPENEEKWQEIMKRRLAGQLLTKKHDFRVTGPKLYRQLEVGFNYWQKHRTVQFEVKDESA